MIVDFIGQFSNLCFLLDEGDNGEWEHIEFFSRFRKNILLVSETFQVLFKKS
jgi:hypothetical protein